MATPTENKDSKSFNSTLLASTDLFYKPKGLGKHSSPPLMTAKRRYNSTAKQANQQYATICASSDEVVLHGEPYTVGTSTSVLDPALDPLLSHNLARGQL